jgi:hypothetical protein
VQPTADSSDASWSRCRRCINSGTRVQRFHCEPGCIDPDHFKTSRSHSAHSGIAELGRCRLTVKAPRRTSIWSAALNQQKKTVVSFPSPPRIALSNGEVMVKRVVDLILLSSSALDTIDGMVDRMKKVHCKKSTLQSAGRVPLQILTRNRRICWHSRFGQHSLREESIIHASMCNAG